MHDLDLDVLELDVLELDVLELGLGSERLVGVRVLVVGELGVGHGLRFRLILGWLANTCIISSAETP